MPMPRTPRTYSHLQHLRRVPTEYEIASSRLLYYPGRGFEVASPGAEWIARYQAESPLRCEDWDGFADPRSTTYASWVALQRDQEAHVAALLDDPELPARDAMLSKPWIATLARVLAPLRFPCHGLQLVASYVGSMAPSSQIVIACMLQAGDEMRRVQHLAYRLRLLQIAMPQSFGDGRDAWQAAPEWQPTRELVERLLVVRDWGESLVALQLVVKPAFDELFCVQLARLARSSGDDVLDRLLGSMARDCRWHAEWSTTLLRRVAADAQAVEVIRGFIATWAPRADAAVDAMREPFEASLPAEKSFDFELVRQAVRAERERRLALVFPEV